MTGKYDETEAERRHCDPLPRLCRTCGTEHDGEHATDCARCAEINADWQAAAGPTQVELAARRITDAACSFGVPASQAFQAQVVRDLGYPRLYVAGPMTGLPDYNLPLFAATTALLESVGYQVENPGVNGADTSRPYTEYLRAGLNQLLRCDAVATLEGWWTSGGARWEVQTAGILGMEVRPAAEWLARAADDADVEGLQ